MKTRRLALTDAQWRRLSPLLGKDQSSRRPGRPARDHRLMIDRCLWVLRTGAPWRDLPRRFGPWQTVYHRYHRWTADGTWPLILSRLGQDHDGADGETQSVRPSEAANQEASSGRSA